MTIDGAGNLFGTAVGGGTGGNGVVWEIPESTLKAGKPWLSDIVSFNYTNGGSVSSGVTMDGTGNLFGTAFVGGSGKYGVVWEVSASSIKAGKPAITVLADFNFSNGAYPMSKVTLDAAGDLFGTTSDGGTSKSGVVWEIAK